MLVLAQRNPSNIEELAQALVDVPWRLERFGDELLNTLTDGNPT